MKKTSKGIRGYPDTWRSVLNTAKDAVRADMIINEPFLTPAKTRGMVTERFHEVQLAMQDAKIIPEPGELISAEATPKSLTMRP